MRRGRRRSPLLFLAREEGVPLTPQDQRRSLDLVEPRRIVNRENHPFPVLAPDAGRDLEALGDRRVEGLEVAEARCRTEEDVIEAERGASALLTQYAPITVRVLAELPELRMVGRYGVGYDIVDFEAARERGVWVANVPDYGTEEVAAHALSMTFALLRHLPLYDREVRGGRWHAALTGPLYRLKNLTLGVVGLGRIGGTFARRASPWYGRTLGCDP